MSSTVAKRLVVLGCSATKIQADSALPAITLYDGPTFRVLRAFLRAYRWPRSLSVAVFSAKYGMIGGLSHISPYDQRMTPQRAIELASTVKRTLQEWGLSHARMDLVLGQDHLRGIDPQCFSVSTPPMGYQYLALGGLVPRLDADVKAIVEAVRAAVQKLPTRPWVHLMGIFRPTLQPYFRELSIGSFDSATYFRKAWLRSDQNYLGVDGRWYAAIRVPPLNDPRTKNRLRASGMSESVLHDLETDALTKLRGYDKGQLSLESALNTVLEYDRLLARSELVDEKLISAYRKTLENRPWRVCQCAMCSAPGIES